MEMSFTSRPIRLVLWSEGFLLLCFMQTMKWNSVNLILLCKEIPPRFFDASAGSSSVWWIHGETVTRCCQSTCWARHWFLDDCHLHHPNQVKESWGCCVRHMLNQHFWTLQSLRYRGYYSKLQLSWRCRRDFWLLNLVFLTQLEGGKNRIKKKKKKDTRLMRFSQGLQTDAESIRKKKKIWFKNQPQPNLRCDQSARCPLQALQIQKSGVCSIMFNASAPVRWNAKTFIH